MEINQQTIPNLLHPSHSCDEKYVSGISTIFVANIQEVKDRMSQIEYMFCNQLFPIFQLRASEHAELAFKEKEKNLLCQITELQSEKQRFVEENQLLNLEKAKFTNMESQLRQKNVEVNKGMEELQNLQKLVESKASLIHGYENTIKALEGKTIMLLDKLKSLEIETEELRVDLMNKTRELDGLKKHEDKENGLNPKLEIMQKKVDELQSALREKCKEVDKGKGLQGNLLKKIEFQASEVMHNEQLLNKRDTENILLGERINKLVNRVDELQKELGKRNNELEERSRVHEQLLKRIDSSNMEMIGEYGQEKKLLLDKQRELEEKVNKLQKSLSERIKESTEGMELNAKLKQQLDATDSNLQSTKRRYGELFDSYKHMKSQYLFLCKKHGLIAEMATPHKKIDDERDTTRTDQRPVTSFDTNHKASKAVYVENEGSKPECKQEILEDNKENIFRPNPVSPNVSNILITPKNPNSTKSCLPAGTKRRTSYWRDTRSHQSRVGPDLHDDFLDTPLEKARGNSSKVMKEQQEGLENINFEDSDDETQEMNIDPVPGRGQVSCLKPGSSGFKYVESVRKKLERDNLKGVECKECKKFYDAVLPEGGANGDGNKQNVRCEHHEGVSRHRYRYAPPLTPEGFWNIGFESEM